MRKTPSLPTKRRNSEKKALSPKYVRRVKRQVCEVASADGEHCLLFLPVLIIIRLQAQIEKISQTAKDDVDFKKIKGGFEPRLKPGCRYFIEQNQCNAVFAELQERLKELIDGIKEDDDDNTKLSESEVWKRSDSTWSGLTQHFCHQCSYSWLSGMRSRSWRSKKTGRWRKTRRRLKVGGAQLSWHEFLSTRPVRINLSSASVKDLENKVEDLEKQIQEKTELLDISQLNVTKLCKLHPGTAHLHTKRPSRSKCSFFCSQRLKLWSSTEPSKSWKMSYRWSERKMPKLSKVRLQWRQQVVLMCRLLMAKWFLDHFRPRESVGIISVETIRHRGPSPAKRCREFWLEYE